MGDAARRTSLLSAPNIPQIRGGSEASVAYSKKHPTDRWNEHSGQIAAAERQQKVFVVSAH